MDYITLVPEIREVKEGVEKVTISLIRRCASRWWMDEQHEGNGMTWLPCWSCWCWRNW